MSSLLYRPTSTDQSAALSGTPPPWRSTVDLQTPLQRSSAAASPFSASVDEIRARLHDVVRSIDEVMSAAESVSATQRSPNALAAASRARAVAELARATGGPVSSRDASLALLRARRASSPPLPTAPVHDAVRRTTTTTITAHTDPPSAQPRLAADTVGPTSLASSVADTDPGTVFSATHTAALDFWRLDGRRGLHGPPLPPPPPLPHSFAGSAASTSPTAYTESRYPAPMPAAVTPRVSHGSDNAHASDAAALAPSHAAHDVHCETGAPTAPPPWRWPIAPATAAAAAPRPSTDTDTLTDATVTSTRSSHPVSSTTAADTMRSTGASTARARREAEATPLPLPLSRPPQAAPQPVHAAASASPASSMTSEGGGPCHRAPPALRARFDDADGTAAAAPSALAAPSPTAQTLSARLAALRAADAEQRRRLDADVHAILRATAGAAGAAAATAGHASALHDSRSWHVEDADTRGGVYGVNASAPSQRAPAMDAPHRPPPPSTWQRADDAATAAAAAAAVAAEAPASGFTGGFSAAAASPARGLDPPTPSAEPYASSVLVRSPPTQHTTEPARTTAAASRHAERTTRLGETSAIVASALQRQAALEAAWRAAQREPPPPSAAGRGGLHDGARTGTRGGHESTAPYHAGGAALTALSTSTAPLDVLHARLSPSTALTVSHEGTALPMQAELAVRERLAERRNRTPALSGATAAAASAMEGQRYVRLSEARDREVVAHLHSEVARQTAVQAAAQARVAHLREALPEPPDVVTGAELGAMRVHAQQLERLRAQLHQQVGRSPLRVAPAAPRDTAAPAACDAVPRAETNAVLRTAARGTPTGETRTAAAPDEAVTMATASTRLRRADVAVDARYDSDTGRVGAVVPGSSHGSGDSDADAAREPTPECAGPPGAATGLRGAVPRQRQRRAADVVASHDVDGSSDSASHSERDRLTSTQLPPQLGTPQRRVQTTAAVDNDDHDDTPSPSPVKPQPWRARPAPHGPARAAPTVQTPAHLAVTPSHDVERDLISSSPSGGRAAGGGGGSLTPARLASIQSTSLHVSPQRGTAWQRVPSTSASSSSSSYAASAFSAATSPRRPSPRAAHRAPSPAPSVAAAAAAPSPRGRFVVPPPSRHGDSARRDLDDPVAVERRAVQREVNTRTALRAQAMLTEYGLSVEVQLAGRRVPAMVQLSKDGSELLFHLDRVAHPHTTSAPTTPRASPAPSSRTSALGVVAGQPQSSVRFPHPQHPSPVSAVAAPPPARFQPPPQSTAGAGLVRVPAGPSAPAHARHTAQPATAPPSGGVWVRRPVGVGALIPASQLVRTPPGSGRVAAAVQQGPHASAPAAQLRPRTSPPPQQQQQQRTSARSPSAAHLVSPSVVGRPVHVRELHHFPCALARVYVPHGVLGYERDLGLGGPRTWEDVSGVLCGPASFEVLRRYGCPLFAAVRGPACAPYRVYLIIPEFQRIDIPQDAVLLVLDFKQRVDWVLFLLALQHNVVGRDTADRRRRPVLSYGRALWMLAAQRLHRARALRGTNPFDSAAARLRTHRPFHRPRGGGGGVDDDDASRRGEARAVSATRHGDPAAVHGALDGTAAREAARTRGNAPPHAGHNAAAAAVAAAVPAVPLSAQETSKPRFPLLRRMSRSLGRKSSSQA